MKERNEPPQSKRTQRANLAELLELTPDPMNSFQRTSMSQSGTKTKFRPDQSGLDYTIIRKKNHRNINKQFFDSQ